MMSVKALTFVNPADAVDAELDLDIYLERLQAEKAYWKRLSELRAQAVSGQGLAEYRRFLERGIARLRERDGDVMNAVAEERAADEFLRWMAAERQRLGIDAIEHDRGISVEAWCERWQPASYRAYARAFSAMCDSPSYTALRRLKEATTHLLDAYTRPAMLSDVGSDSATRDGEADPCHRVQ